MSYESCPIDIQLPNYTAEHARTKASAGGALFCKLSYKPRTHLKIFPWQDRISIYRKHLSRNHKSDYWLHLCFILESLIAVTFLPYYVNFQKNPLNRYFCQETLILTS